MKQRGFIALMSAIVIAAILLALSIEQSVGGFMMRRSLVSREQKMISDVRMRGCVFAARLLIAADAVYSGNQTIRVGGGECVIGDVSVHDGLYDIAVSSQEGDVVSVADVVINSATYSFDIKQK